MRWPVDVKFSLALPREAMSIPVIRRVLGDALRALGVTEGCIADILVAISEACTNAVQHAQTATRFDVVASVDGGYCVLKVVDRGPGMDTDFDRRIHTEAESGRGLRIMRALVDDVTFDSGPDGGTAVYLQKRLAWRAEAPMRRLDHELVSAAG
jgi:serine/threonine-protein kinase RsbW